MKRPAVYIIEYRLPGKRTWHPPDGSYRSCIFSSRLDAVDAVDDMNYMSSTKYRATKYVPAKGAKK